MTEFGGEFEFYNRFSPYGNSRLIFHCVVLPAFLNPDIKQLTIPLDIQGAYGLSLPVVTMSLQLIGWTLPRSIYFFRGRDEHAAPLVLCVT